MSDELISEQAVEAAAKAACEAVYPPSATGRVKAHDSWEEIEEWERDAWRATAEAAVAAALPHLRVQETGRTITDPGAIERCPVLGREDWQRCMRPALHDGQHEWPDEPDEPPHPRPVVDREALAQQLLARFYVTEGEAIGRGSEVPQWSDLSLEDRAEWRNHAWAVLALLPTEEGEGS